MERELPTLRTARSVCDFLRDHFAELERYEARMAAGAGTLVQQRDLDRAAGNRADARFYDRCLRDYLKDRLTFERWCRNVDRWADDLVGTPIQAP